MQRFIEVRGARTHNLKGVSVSIPHRRLSVVTGVSGSGKSSLAFDTLYAEGQMRYVESLSAYSRQFLEQLERPPVESITGLPPAIALEQRNTVKNARSTVGTATEIADYLRLLFASVGRTFCPDCGIRVERHTVQAAVDACLALAPASRLIILAPVARTAGNGSAETRPWESLRRELQRQGFRRLWIAGRIVDLADIPDPDAPGSPARLRAAGRSHLAAQFTGRVPFPAPAEIEVVLDRLVLADPPADSRSRLAESLESAFKAGAGRAAVLVLNSSGAEQKRLPFDVRFNCARCGRTFPRPEPQLFSFNSALGACPTCEGFGRTSDLDPDKIIPDPRKSIDNGAIICWQTPAYKQVHKDCRRACRARSIRTDVPYVDLPDAARRFLWEGEGDWPGIRGFFDWLDTKRYKVHVRVMIARYRGYYRCPTCKGRRLRPEALSVFLVPYSPPSALGDVRSHLAAQFTGRVPSPAPGSPVAQATAGRLPPDSPAAGRSHLAAQFTGRVPSPAPGSPVAVRSEFRVPSSALQSIASLALLPVKDLRRWFDSLVLTPDDEEKAAVLLREIRSRLAYLDDVGLDYLTLDRQTRSLSGGESQRINLASALGSSLTNTLYVLDEPTVGLHARDTHRLLGILRSLIAKGNTCCVVEHDPEVIRAADHLVDLGPGAGEAGGEVIYEGPFDSLAACEASETARQLETHAARAFSPYARRPKGWITISGAREHNLKNLTVRFPLGVLACVTGVSGSGKTTLVHNCLYGQFMHRRGRPVDDIGQCDDLEGHDEVDDILLVDQGPIGLSTRSNPITYVKAYSAIRNLLAQTPKARVAGVTVANFSFNVAGGRCEVCKGVGTVTHDMYFMPDVTVVCQECGGRRFKKKVLDVRWNGKNIDDILDMTVQQAVAHFAEHKSILSALRPLVDVGLGYIRLGQNTSSLSGGEAQRLKLASYLATPRKGQKHLFLFDEPTTGLHLADIQTLLNTFHRLVHAGHSILVIEHNLDFISQADWVIDLGPEGGASGGELVAQGPPETIAKVKHSYTGRFLAQRLKTT